MITMNKIKLKPTFEDERGSIWDILSSEEINHIGFLISKNGSVRGKHFHKIQKQFTLVLNGQIHIRTKNIKDKNAPIEEFILNEMEMIIFEPFVYHSIESIVDSKCIIFTTKSRNNDGYENDTFRVSDIESYVYNE